MKDVHALLNAVRAIGTGQAKSASTDPTKLPDPEEKGPATKSGDGGTEEITPPAPDAKPGTEDATGNTPTDPKLESNGGDANPVKLAGTEALATAQGLREKLASAFAVEEKKAADAMPPVVDNAPTEVKPEAKKDGEACKEGEEKKAGAEESQPAAQAQPATQIEPAFEKVAGEIVRSLVKSAAGRDLLHTAINEVTGVEIARELVKQAAEANEAEEIAFLQKRAAEIELQKEAAEMAHLQAVIDNEVAELTKNASAEDLEDVEKTAVMIKTASEALGDDPIAQQYFAWGVKQAAAIMNAAQGAEDPAAMEAAMAEQMPMPAEGQEPSLEEIIAALEELVASGEIDPQVAETIVQALSEQMGGGAAPAGPEAMKQASDSSEIAARLETIGTMVSQF